MCVREKERERVHPVTEREGERKREKREYTL